MDLSISDSKLSLVEKDLSAMHEINPNNVDFHGGDYSDMPQEPNEIEQQQKN